MNKNQNWFWNRIKILFETLFVCWLVGFFCNPIIFHKEFQLESVWQGWGIVSSAGMLAMMKFAIESFANSPIGKPPIHEMIDKVLGKDEEK